MVYLKNCSIEQLYMMGETRRVFLFGVSKSLDTQLVYRSPHFDLREVAYGIIDNDIHKSNKTISTNKGKILNIYSFEQAKKIINKEDVIVITSVHYDEIIKQLDKEESFTNIDCYILYFVNDYFDAVTDKKEIGKATNEEYIIPPKIHYCWFGDKAIPDKYKQYMESWHKYCPDYQIIRWDETNFDITQHPYTKWAYENEKWPFISDYARLKIIHDQGGIYLDTDVELIRSLDELRKFKAFIGYESYQMIATGLGIGSYKGNSIIKELVDNYNDISYEYFNEYPCTVYQSNYLEKKGVKRNNSFQSIDNGECVILPSDFLCGVRLYTRARQLTENTFSIHHYLGNWAGVQQYTEQEIYIQNNELWKRIEENVSE